MADFTAWVDTNKALWTRVYDEVIQPDLEKEWKTREEKHEKALKQNEEKQQILFNHLTDEILKTARLAKENEQLRKQLETREEHNLVNENERLKPQFETRDEVVPPPHQHKTAHNVVSAVSEEEHRSLVQKFNKLDKQYRAVSQEVVYLQRKNAAVMQKNRDMKENVRAWQDYVDRQSGKRKPKNQARREEGRSRLSPAHALLDDWPPMPSSPVSMAAVRTPPSPADFGPSSPAPMAPLPRSPVGTTDTGDGNRNSTATVTPKPRAQAEDIQAQQQQDTDPAGRSVSSHIQRVISDSEHHQSGNPGSSQTTVDEHVEPTSRHEQAMDDEDDDIPEFVSERSLKRKRGPPTKSRFQIYADHSSDGTPIKPHRIKEEQYSSPPVSAYKLARNETMDLDDPAPDVLKTPRRPQREPCRAAEMLDTLRQQRSNSAPHTQTIKTENVQADNLTRTDGPAESAELPPSEALASIEVRAFSEPTQAPDTVLQPLDLNILSTASEEPSRKRPRRSEREHADKHEFLMESGEGPPLTRSEKENFRLPPHQARAHMNRRLQALKNSSTPKIQPSTKIKSEQHVFTPPPPPPPPQVSKSRPNRPDNPIPSLPLWTLKPSGPRPTTLLPPPPKPQPTHPRLRNQPVTTLTIQDFKPNPASNQGHPYAFHETVRRKADKLCLPGCTNQSCCGPTFRAFASSLAPLSAQQQDELLRDYLGGGDAYTALGVERMGSAAKDELVLQARTKKLATEAGKHREAYERPRSPPGFWRVDWPDTQERKEDRARAAEEERKVVQERWLEAHRKGGRWVFRDE
ncbi:hypothetical protein BDW02DRAFT_638781 [Decorospora gaudefroyi]|uniref:DNA endonuclease activator Ctp1 C-terminal domain-containing protein n=1 Tax=Decorospora gaudefroyi TaxID=184978 RepID=A0A6A5KGX6_9PLEO|nr:hypothetical protein BDW02DRAFT_638781 [Decorospora gaudefroyi]